MTGHDDFDRTLADWFEVDALSRSATVEPGVVASVEYLANLDESATGTRRERLVHMHQVQRRHVEEHHDVGRLTTQLEEVLKG